MQPTLGRIIHYRGLNGEVYAAIISGVFVDTIELTVFYESGPQVVSDVTQGTDPGTWDWMPYQKEQAKIAPQPEKTAVVSYEWDNGSVTSHFGAALIALKKGHKVARSGWNGKGMWLALVKADNYVIMQAPHGDGQDTAEGECEGLLP